MFLKRLYCILFILLIPSFVLAQNIRPSFKQGFARSAAESKYPDLWRGLVGAWVANLGCTGITTLHDVSGSRNNGTLNGSMTQDDWVIGRNGYALDFDGTNDYVDLGNDTTLQVNTQTLCGWVKTTDVGYYFASRASGNGGGNIFINSKVNFVIGATNSSATSSTSVDDGEWHYICVTFDDDTNVVNFYLDGSADGTATNTATINHSFNKLIGKRGSDTSASHRLDGLIDNVCIYNRALTSQEFKFLYENPMALFQLKPRVYKAPTAAGGVRRVIIISKLLEQRIFKGYDFVFKEDFKWQTKMTESLNTPY